MRVVRSKASIALLAVGLVALAACGSSGGSKSGSGGGSGDPIKIYFLNDQGSSTSLDLPEGTWAAQAAVDHINKDLGGINGRDIELQTCFLDETPATATKCANEAVAANPDAIVSGGNSLDDAVAKIAKQSGIPFFVYNGSTLESNAFRFTDDQLGTAIAAGLVTKDKGGKSLTAIALNFPIVTNALDQAVPILANMGIKFNTVTVEIGTADQSATWQAATSKNPDAIVLEEDPTSCVASVKAKATLGFDGLFVLNTNCDNDAVHTAGGDSLNGMVVISSSSVTDATSADTKTYMAAIKKYSPQIIKKGVATSPNAANQFQILMNIYAVLKPIKNPSSLDAGSIMSAMKAAKNVPVFMGGGASFTCDGKQVPGYPSLCSLVQTQSLFNDGKTKYVGPLGDQVVAAIQAAQ